jgi:glutamyl-Q tRNA(Asp) synthetase
VTQPVFRFAPSPNGRLHLGHAYSALLNERLAACSAGRFLLRIEDIDPARCRPEFERAIFDDLAWLGLAWERPVRRQSDHFQDYWAAFDRLRRRGFAYPCVCSRQGIAAEVARRESATGQAWPRDPDGAPLYPGTCRTLSATEPWGRMTSGGGVAWRLDMGRALAAAGPAPLECRRLDSAGDVCVVDVDPARWGDAVVVRKEARRATIFRSWWMTPCKV